MSFIFDMMEKERRFNEWARETFGGKATPENIALIKRNHICPKCQGAVSYLKKASSDSYEFVCKECGTVCDDAPLKKR